MTTPEHRDSEADDEVLLADLRRSVGAADPRPPGLADANRALLSWRDPDSELAALVADSRQLDAAVRGSDDPVLLRFAAGASSLTLEISSSGDAGRRLVGQIEPGVAASVDIRRPDGSRRVTCDGYGRFRLDGIGPGPLSLRWMSVGADPVPVETPWLLL